MLNDEQKGDPTSENVNSTKPLVSGCLCDGCNVRQPWEHRCHGADCNCDSPICMEKQGRLTHEELMQIVNAELNNR